MKWLTLILLLASPCFGSNTTPRIYYTDLISGPNSGGEGNNGVIVTIYGIRFGASQGASTVTIGGGAVAAYKSWSDSKVAVAIGASAATGNIVLTTTAGASNTIAFTVRSGNIYYVATTGSDGAAGSFAAPWATLTHARDTIAAGDTVYAENGIAQTANDGQGWSAAFTIRNSGSAGNPMAFIAYPGATVTVGATAGPNYGMRTAAIITDWVVAGFTLIGNVDSAAELDGSDIRVIGNLIECPNGNAPAGCYTSDTSSNIKFYGNEVTNVSTNVPGTVGKTYHAVYFTTNTVSVDVGWNDIHDNKSCRGVQFYSTGGNLQYDLHVHDNLIYNIRCDGINFASIDPSQGTVEAYNNVIHDAGQGPNPADGAANYTCIYFPGFLGVLPGTTGSGAALVYNNTMYNCGSLTSATNENGAIGRFDQDNPSVTLTMNNNIVYSTGSEVYLESGSSQISGSNNLWYGVGSSPAGFTSNVNSDPLFTNLGSDIFTLTASSPAIGAGTSTNAAPFDYSGYARPQGSSYDIGAYEFIASGPSMSHTTIINGSIVQAIAPPTNLVARVIE